MLPENVVPVIIWTIPALHWVHVFIKFMWLFSKSSGNVSRKVLNCEFWKLYFLHIHIILRKAWNSPRCKIILFSWRKWFYLVCCHINSLWIFLNLSHTLPLHTLQNQKDFNVRCRKIYAMIKNMRTGHLLVFYHY